MKKRDSLTARLLTAHPEPHGPIGGNAIPSAPSRNPRRASGSPNDEMVLRIAHPASSF